MLVIQLFGEGPLCLCTTSATLDTPVTGMTQTTVSPFSNQYLQNAVLLANAISNRGKPNYSVHTEQFLEILRDLLKREAGPK